MVKRYNERVKTVAPGTALDAPSAEVEEIETLRAEDLKKTLEFQEQLIKFREKLKVDTEHLIQAAPAKT